MKRSFAWISLCFVASTACAPASKGKVQVSQSVGPSGGTVSNQGASVSLPAGAVSGNVTITNTQDPNAPTPAGATVLGTPYTFGPEGQQFSVPVTITLPFDPTKLPAGASTSDIVVVTAPAGSTDFVSIGGMLTDSTHIAAMTTHFSTFLPIIIPHSDAGTSSSGPDAGSGGGHVDGGTTSSPDAGSGSGCGPVSAGGAAGGCQFSETCGSNMYEIQCSTSSLMCSCLVNSASVATVAATATTCSGSNLPPAWTACGFPGGPSLTDGGTVLSGSDGGSSATPDGGSAATPDGGSAATPDGGSSATPDGGSAATPDGGSEAAELCSQVLNCIGNCGLSAECQNTCYAGGTQQAQTLAAAVVDCVIGFCPGSDGGVCETASTACSSCEQSNAQSSCSQQYSACIAASDGGVATRSDGGTVNTPDAGVTPNDGGSISSLDAGAGCGPFGGGGGPGTCQWMLTCGATQYLMECTNASQSCSCSENSATVGSVAVSSTICNNETVPPAWTECGFPDGPAVSDGGTGAADAGAVAVDAGVGATDAGAESIVCTDVLQCELECTGAECNSCSSGASEPVAAAASTASTCILAQCPNTDGGPCVPPNNQFCAPCQEQATAPSTGACGASYQACLNPAVDAGPSTEPCSSIYSCDNNCGANAACTQNCLNSAASPAQDLFAPLQSCLENDCPTDVDGGACAQSGVTCQACWANAIQTDCINGYLTCEGNGDAGPPELIDGGGSPITCAGIVSCSSQCDGGSDCASGCDLEGSSPAQSLYATLTQCVYTHCPGPCAYPGDTSPTCERCSTQAYATACTSQYEICLGGADAG